LSRHDLSKKDDDWFNSKNENQDNYEKCIHLISSVSNNFEYISNILQNELCTTRGLDVFLGLDSTNMDKAIHTLEMSLDQIIQVLKIMKDSSQ
jgi:hypothetical protein